MDVKLQAKIGTPAYEMDMQYGLETLRGTSDAVCLIGESVLSDRVPEKLTHAHPVRTKLRKSFKGSYGINFTLSINKREHLRKLRQIGGQDVLAEVISFYIYEALYLESNELSEQARGVVVALEELEDELINRLRNPLKKMHQISRKFGFAMSLDHVSRTGARRIASLTRDTANNLTDLIVDQTVRSYRVIITRFNSFTGNGSVNIPFITQSSRRVVMPHFGTQMVSCH